MPILLIKTLSLLTQFLQFSNQRTQLLVTWGLTDRPLSFFITLNFFLIKTCKKEKKSDAYLIPILFFFSTAEQYILNHNVMYNHTFDYQNHTDHGIHYFIGVGLALMAAIGSAAMGVCINFLKEFKLNVLLCYSGGACALQLLAIVAFDKKSKLFYDPVDANLNQIVLLAGISIVAMLLNTLCYQLLDPSVASIFRTLELVFAFILQSYFTNSLPNSITLYGTSLVIFSAIVIPLENIVLSRLPYSIRKYI